MMKWRLTADQILTLFPQCEILPTLQERILIQNMTTQNEKNCITELNFAVCYLSKRESSLS